MIFWSNNFGSKKFCDLMILIWMFLVISWSWSYCFLWSRSKKPVILWSRNEENLWSCDLKMKKTHDPVILKWRKAMISWSENSIILWSYNLKMKQTHYYTFISKLRIKWSHNSKNDLLIWDKKKTWSRDLRHNTRDDPVINLIYEK